MLPETLILQGDKCILENLWNFSDIFLDSVGFRLVELGQQVAVTVVNKGFITLRHNIFHTDFRSAV